MGYSILKYGCPILTDIEDLEKAKEAVSHFVTPIAGSEYIEIRLNDDTVSIGYFDGKRFHWTKGKDQTEACKSLSFVSKPPLWRECSESG